MINAKGIQRIEESFNFIEERSNGAYAAGGAFTVVGPYLFVFYRWGNGEGIEIKKSYPKYAALIEDLVKWAAVKDTLAAERIDSTL